MLQEAPRYYRAEEQETAHAEEMIKNFGRTAVVVSHPDDDAFIFGGTLAMVAKDNDVLIITATKGEKGASVHGWHEEETALKREGEQLAALEALGIPSNRQRWLGYTDGELTSINPHHAVERIVEEMEAFHPDTVITFGPDGVTGHPDHITSGIWTSEAFTRFAKPDAKLYSIAVPREWMFGRSRRVLEDMNFFYPGYPAPTWQKGKELHISLKPSILDQKIAAVMAHESQYNHVLPAFSPDAIKNLLGKERLILAETTPTKTEHILFRYDRHAA